MAVDVVLDGNGALDHLAVTRYDVVVLDRDLPGTRGDEVCRRIVAGRSGSRVLMLTAASTVRERVDGLGLGADDYLPKPFDFSELVAPVRALGRRSAAALPPTLESGEVALDPAGGRIPRRAASRTQSEPPGTSPPATCIGASASVAATTSSRNSERRSTTCSGGLTHRLSRSGTSWPTPPTNCEPRSPRNGPCSKWPSPTQMPPRRRCDRPARRCWRWAISRNVSSRRCSPWPPVSGESSSGNPLIWPRSPRRFSWSGGRTPSSEASTSTQRSPRLRRRVTRAWPKAWWPTWWTTPCATTWPEAGPRSRRQRPPDGRPSRSATPEQ